MLSSKKILSVVMATIFLSGCSIPENIFGSDQLEGSGSAGQGEQIDSWECETEEDGLGESITCQSTTKDDNGTIWVFTFMCASDLQTFHSIVGTKADFSTVYWTVGAQSNVARIRIDSKQVRKWKFGTKADGRGIAFVQLTNKNGDENASSWELMSRLSNSQSFGFKAFDSEGFAQSAKFDVKGIDSIGAAFSDLGCMR